jgi:nucleotide-binding universal stress UspA family protein
MSNAYRILVAIDLKSGTDRLLAEAQRYAQALDAIVNIIHVADPDPDFVPYIKGAGYEQTKRDNRAKEFRLEHQQVHAFAEKMRSTGIQVDQALTVQGSTLEAILKEARKLCTDLLILGSHHHGTLYRLWYGDVAIDAAKEAPCALLVVPILPNVKDI